LNYINTEGQVDLGAFQKKACLADHKFCIKFYAIIHRPGKQKKTDYDNTFRKLEDRKRSDRNILL